MAIRSFQYEPPKRAMLAGEKTVYPLVRVR